jgi:ADP-ribosylglycohydrolase
MTVGILGLTTMRRHNPHGKEALRADHYRGCLLGLAADDALGTTLEFTSPGTFKRIEDKQLAGAFYGNQGIPESWRARLALRERIVVFADQLCAVAESND